MVRPPGSTRVERGSAATRIRRRRSRRSTPRGNSARLAASRSAESRRGSGAAANVARAGDARPGQAQRRPRSRAFDLKDQRGRAVRIVRRCRARSASKAGALARIGEEREGRLAPDRSSIGRAGVEAQPVATSGAPASGASSQTGVSWSSSVSATARGAARQRRAAARRSLASGLTCPGRAIASIMARKIDCAVEHGSAKPARARVIQSSPRTSVKKSTRVAAVCCARLRRARASSASRIGASTFRSTASRDVGASAERIAQRDQPRLLAVAPEHVGEADLAAREPHGGARDRRFAEIERRAVAADAAAHHHQAAFGRRSSSCAGSAPSAASAPAISSVVASASTRHRGAARRARRSRPMRRLCAKSIAMAKLSMLLDNSLARPR